jgi:mannose-6-phosphate isomerase-like protein (cupin superfamily)
VTHPARQLLPALEEMSSGIEFPRRPVGFSHGLCLDPRMELESIAALAERLPESVVCDTAAQALLVPRGGPPKGVLERPGDVIRNLSTNNSWLTVLNVEDDPAYAEMMDTALDQVQLGMRKREGEMRERAAFILTSSPSSVTPVHFDIEHSLLMQVSGSKRVTIGRFESEAAHRHEVDRYFDGSHGRIESMPPELVSFDLEPGTGVYIPALVPHWVHNDPAVSISITLTYFTDASLRDSRIEDFNSRLRRLHLDPRPPGKSVVADTAKTVAIGALRIGGQLRSGIARARERRGVDGGTERTNAT